VVQRLYASYGTVQKKPGDPYRRFANGKWLEGGYMPANASKFGATDYKIRVVYFVPQDRQPTGNYQLKIDVVLKLITEVMTNDLRSKGFETDGPQVERRDGKTVVHLLNSERRARDYNDLPNFNSVKQFNSIAQEVEQHFGSLQDHIVLVFAETYDEGLPIEFGQGMLRERSLIRRTVALACSVLGCCETNSVRPTWRCNGVVLWTRHQFVDARRSGIVVPTRLVRSSSKMASVACCMSWLTRLACRTINAPSKSTLWDKAFGTCAGTLVHCAAFVNGHHHRGRQRFPKRMHGC
jgi:hypothetical protein